MPNQRTPLFVRLPRQQATALDRLAETTGRPKQRIVSDMIATRLLPGAGPLAVGRVDISSPADAVALEVLTLDDAAALLKLPVDAVRARAEAGDLPGRRFGTEWRFARTAVLDWLAQGESSKTRRPPAE